MESNVAVVPASNIPEAQQKAWLTFATRKNELTATLQKYELELQGILNNIPADILGHEKALEQYRKVFNEMKTMRMTFTGMIEQKLLQPLMEPEKRVDYQTSSAYIKANVALLDKKREEKNKAAKQNDHAIEAAAYTTHIKNQYELQRSTYIQTAWREIRVAYEQALQQDGDIQTLVDTLKTVIAELKFIEPVKYDRKLVTNEEAMKIYAGIEKPKITALREQMLNEADKVFANYKSDKAAQTGKEVVQHIASVEKEVVEEAQTNISINNLVERGAIAAPVIPITGKAIKEISKVDFNGSQEMAVQIIAAFLRHPACFQFLKVKSWEKVVAPMITALEGLANSPAAIKDKELVYKTVEK